MAHPLPLQKVPALSCALQRLSGLARQLHPVFPASALCWQLSLSYIFCCRPCHPSSGSVSCLLYRPVCPLQGIRRISLQAFQMRQSCAIRSAPASDPLYFSEPRTQSLTSHRFVKGQNSELCFLISSWAL